MTIHEISCQLYDLCGGHINHTRMTKKTLERWLRNMAPEVGNRFGCVFQVELADGLQAVSVTRWANQPDGFDYWISDTTEQGIEFWNEWGDYIEAQYKK